MEKAGWYLRDHSRVKIEIPVDGYDAEPWNGVSDYCLYRENGEVLAVVEAKKTAVDVRLVHWQGVGEGGLAVFVSWLSEEKCKTPSR